MILVTLGTQKQPFSRLLNIIEKSNIDDEIIVQAGYTKFNSKKMKIFTFIDYEQMEKLVNEADVIITHGGTGSIVGPLKKNKKIIACPRLKKYGEHVDDHQTQIVDVFSEVGYIMKLDEDDNIDEKVSEIKKKKMTKFVSNTENFIKSIKYEIDN
jgi:UDP-N-acetylglucosamine transferase subunit ALG13